MTPAERGLFGAGIILCLVLGPAKQRLARFIALFASLFLGGRSLRHPQAVPPALEAALAGGGADHHGAGGAGGATRSYRSARKGRLEHWRYRMRVVEAMAAYKEGDEAGEALFGETEEEAEDNAGSDESALRWRRRGPAAPITRQRTPPAPSRPCPANNEAKDIASLAEAHAAGNKTEDIAGSAEAPPRCQRGRAT